jgi:hypothetical protein
VLYRQSSASAVAAFAPATWSSTNGTFALTEVIVHEDGAIEGLTAKATRLIRMLDLG